MKSIGMTPRLWTSAAAALLCAAETASAQENWYIGLGFARELYPTAGPVGTVAIGDFQLDGHWDLASWRNGVLTIFNRFGDYDDEHLIGAVDTFAITRCGDDRMWHILGDQLSRIVWPESLDSPYSEPVDLPLETTISVFRGQERPPVMSGGVVVDEVSYLLLIDDGGTRARFLKVVDGQPIFPPFQHGTSHFGESQFYDLAVVDWDGNGTDEYATYSNAGLRIFNSAHGQVAFFAGVHQDAFVEVMPGRGNTEDDRDLLFCQRRTGTSAPLDLLVMNSSRQQTLPDVTALGLKRVYFADFTDDDGSEVVLSLANERLAGLLSQVDWSETSPLIFTINEDNDNLINMVHQVAPAVSSAPAAVAVADVDYDGDDDVLFMDDRGLAMVVTSTKEASEALRVEHVGLSPKAAPEYPSTQNNMTFTFEVELTVPPNTVAVEIEIFGLQDTEDQEAEYLGMCVLTDANPSIPYLQDAIEVAIQTPWVVSEPPDEIYQVLYRAVDDLDEPTPWPVRVEPLSPDQAINDWLADMTEWFYPWIFPEDAGGTTQRPHISPGGGVGPH